MMMKLSFVLILSLSIHGGKRVAGEPSAKDIPDLTMSKQDGEPVLTEEELKDLNQLRKDVLTSLEDLRKNMESDEGKEAVNNRMEAVIKAMTKDSYDFTDKEELQQHVEAFQEVLQVDLTEAKINEKSLKVENKSDKKKIEDFKEKMLPDFEKRFEPFDQYI